MDGRGAMLLVGLFLLIGSIDGRLTSSEKDEILQYHNDVRGTVSPKAANMRKLTWNRGLASMAQDWANTCSNGHNPVESNGRFDYIGENIASSTDTDILGMVEGWYNEKQIYTFSTNTCTPIPGNPLLASCGHFTQVVWADTEYIGCGFKKGCTSGYPNHFVCNYGTGGNINGNKPYTKGERCSKCPDDGYQCNAGLCEKV